MWAYFAFGVAIALLVVSPVLWFLLNRPYVRLPHGEKIDDTPWLYVNERIFFSEAEFRGAYERGMEATGTTRLIREDGSESTLYVGVLDADKYFASSESEDTEKL